MQILLFSFSWCNRWPKNGLRSNSPELLHPFLRLSSTIMFLIGLWSLQTWSLGKSLSRGLNIFRLSKFSFSHWRKRHFFKLTWSYMLAIPNTLKKRLLAILYFRYSHMRQSLIGRYVVFLGRLNCWRDCFLLKQHLKFFKIKSWNTIFVMLYSTYYLFSISTSEDTWKP